MQRNKFVHLGLTAAAAFTTPFSLMANAIKKTREEKGFKVDAGSDRHNKSISLFDGDTFDCKVSTTDTAGSIYMFESKRIEEGGPSHHYHFEQDEWWYVLEGEFIFKIGDTLFNAKKGDSVFGPRMVPHSFSKTGGPEAKLLMFFQPAGKMEVFFSKMSQGAAKGMSEEQQDAFRIEHGFKRVGPPIKNLKF
ncbi:MAG: cupin domain-containing protein [Chitinophagaceae bacterium]